MSITKVWLLVTPAVSITNLWLLLTPTVSITNLWLLMTPTVSITYLWPFNATDFLVAISSALNKCVKMERHIMPSVDHTLAQLSNAKVFSKIDANSGFWQIELLKQSALLTTFITPFGRYCFNRLPFGISTAPELFQKRMLMALEGLDGVACLIDDILVHGSTQEEHDRRLIATLERLQKCHITLNREKCVFSSNTVHFLGHVIDEQGIA